MYLPLKSSVFTFTLQYVNSNLGHQNKKKLKEIMMDEIFVFFFFVLVTAMLRLYHVKIWDSSKSNLRKFKLKFLILIVAV